MRGALLFSIVLGAAACSPGLQPGQASDASPPSPSPTADPDRGEAVDVGLSAAPDAATPTAAPCPAQPLAPGDYLRQISSGGLQRSFYLHVPKSAKAGQPAPLLLALHGGGHNAQGFEAFAHLAPKSDSAGFLLVWPDGTGLLGFETWNSGSCCPTATSNKIDDVDFARAIIDAVAKEACVDPRRVFAAGFSNGGMQAHRLACQLSDRIAAVASVAGGLGAANAQNASAPFFTCTPQRHVPVLHIHGSKDACYPWAGGASPLVAGVTFTSVDETIAGWLQRNGCGQSFTVSFKQGSTACHRYQCPDDGTVELCKVDGGGHYWPGGGDWPLSTILCGIGAQGALTSDLVANDAIWTFFEAHPMP